MAVRRMFDKGVILTDAFLDMPAGAKCLYFILNMAADDDGFVASPKAIMRQCGATEDDLRVLIAKRYLLGFPSGVVVIKHWRMHNTIRADRYTQTTYREEMATLALDEKKAYIEAEKLPATSWQPNGNQMATKRQPNGNPDQVRLDQDRLGKYIEEEVGIEDHPSPTPSSSIPTLYLQLSTGEMYPVTGERIEELQKAFPDIEVLPELVIMAETMRTNPAKRRTAARIEATIVNWLQIARERALERQKNAEAKAEAGAKPKKNAFGNFAQHDYNFDEIDRALDLA